MGRKHCGKRRKCWLPAFSPFPTMFVKGHFISVVKIRDCVVKRTDQLRAHASVRIMHLVPVILITTKIVGLVSPLTSAEACEKSSQWLWKESCVSTGVRRPGNACASPTAMI